MLIELCNRVKLLMLSYWCYVDRVKLIELCNEVMLIELCDEVM